ncbi:hypothetical protein GCM10007079_35710 [Nocardiopsis terrae]|nr:hypothetical protein GCM10007079_35710 [Nocardiopsis terrae]
MPFSLAVATTGPVGALAAGAALVAGAGVFGAAAGHWWPHTAPRSEQNGNHPAPAHHANPEPGDHDPGHEAPPTSRTHPSPRAPVRTLKFFSRIESRSRPRTSTPRPAHVGEDTPAERHQRPQQTSNSEAPSKLEHLLC